MKILVAMNVTLLVASVMVGACVVRPAGAGRTLAAVPGTAEAVFAPVVAANGAVVALMMLGSVSLGMLSALLVAWNGVHLGAGLAALFETQPAVAWLVMRYVPIEFGALVVASSASMEMSYQIARTLFARRAGSFAPPVLAFGGACVLLIIAAAIESRVAVRIAQLG